MYIRIFKWVFRNGARDLLRGAQTRTWTWNNDILRDGALVLMQKLLLAVLPNVNDATRFLTYREENVIRNIGKWQMNSGVAIRIFVLKNSEQHDLINCNNFN